MRIQFTLFGKPEPQGSTRAFLVNKITPTGTKVVPIITTDNPRLKCWRHELGKMALVTMASAGRATPLPPRVAVRASPRQVHARCS